MLDHVDTVLVFSVTSSSLHSRPTSEGLLSLAGGHQSAKTFWLFDTIATGFESNTHIQIHACVRQSKDGKYVYLHACWTENVKR